MIPYSLSFYDLMQYKPFKKAVESNDKESFNKIIYTAGMEIAHGYEIVEILHRPVSDKTPWFGPRIEGMERTDDEWIKTNLCSLDAIIASVPDYNKRVELKMMSRTSDSRATEIMLERSAHAERKKDKENLGIKE